MTTRSKKEVKTMKRTFMKFLPIAAAILLATSCSKDGDNDANIVNPNPEPEPIEVPVAEPQHYTLSFSLTVDNGTSLSKAEVPQPEFPEFQEGVSYLLTITAGGTKVADLPIKTIADNKQSATFEGDLDFGTNAELKAAVENKTTQLVASINADKKTETASYTSLDDALSASYYESAAFYYEDGGVEGISLVSRCAFIDFTVADGQKKVNIDGEWYPQDEKDEGGNITTVNNITNNRVCVAIPVEGESKPVTTRFRKSAKTVSTNTIYTITCDDVIDLGPTFSVLWKATNEKDGTVSSNHTQNIEGFTAEKYYSWSNACAFGRMNGESFDDGTYEDGYRLPTKAEFDDLVKVNGTGSGWQDSSPQGWTFANDYGSVFFPAAGFGGGDGAATYGYYWSGESTGDVLASYCLHFGSGSAIVRSYGVKNTFSVRLVRGL